MTRINQPRQLMLMVQQLYRRGLGRLRYYPHIGGPGAFRYILTVEEMPRMPSLPASRTLTVWESLGFDAEPLPWQKPADDTPAQLASAFVRKYRALAKAARGEDGTGVARWLDDMIEATQPDGYFVLWHDAYNPENPMATLFDGDAESREIPAWPGFRYPIPV